MIIFYCNILLLINVIQDYGIVKESCYGLIKNDVLSRASQIKLLICDVDGVLSDGLIYMGNQGEELKAFHVRDGYGIRCLITSNIDVAIITGRRSKIVEDRAVTLGISHVYQGQSDKRVAFNSITKSLSLQKQQIAYIGDDLIDWPVMAECGLAVAVADAHPLLRDKAHYITSLAGGRGAVRELCDIILFSQEKLEFARGLSI